MTDTPSGNRWEPGPTAENQPPAEPAPELPAGPEVVPVEGVAPLAAQTPLPPSYDVPATAPVGARQRHRGLIAAGIAVGVLAAGGTGYAVGAASSGSSGHDQVTRQGPPPGLDDGDGRQGPDAEHDGGPQGEAG